MKVGYILSSAAVNAYDKAANSQRKSDILTSTLAGKGVGDSISISQDGVYLAVSQQIATILQSSEDKAKKAKAIRDYIILTISTLKSRSSIQVVIQLIQDIVANILDDVELQKELIKLAQYEYNTYEHSVNVGLLGISFLLDRKTERERVIPLGTAMILHDVGKLNIPNDIIEKPGALTPEEYELVKLHPLTGYDYIRAAEMLDGEALNIILDHHENLDGSGYPNGILNLGIYSQICAIVDRYHAMVSYRPYREPMKREKAVSILRGEAQRGKLNGSLLEMFLKFS